MKGLYKNAPMLGHCFVLEICKPGPEVINEISCSTQLSMKFFLLINVKVSTKVGILTFMRRKSVLGLHEHDKC